jgi:hypothetical protein
MASCDAFDVTVNGDIGAALQKVKADVEAQGGTFDGDETGGSLSGTLPLMGQFAATYTVAGNTVTITVTHRPILVSCGVIESKTRDYFAAL